MIDDCGLAGAMQLHPPEGLPGKFPILCNTGPEEGGVLLFGPTSALAMPGGDSRTDVWDDR